MHQRFLYGFIAICTVFCIVLLDAYLAQSYGHGRFGELLTRGSLIPVFFAVLVLGAAFEMLRLFRTLGLRPHALIAVVMSLVLLLSPWLCAARLLGTRPSEVEGTQWQLLWLAVLMVATAVAQLRRGRIHTAFSDIGATWLMVFYLGLLPSFAVMLRSSPDVSGREAAGWVLIFLLVTKVSDIGAYLVGSAIGRHLLMPAVSPGKTIEGALGGVAASVLLAVVFHRLYFWVSGVYPQHHDAVLAADYFLHGFYRGLELWQAIVFGALMSIFGQLGDLVESLFKRAADQKDSASIVPGFGGMLDLLDSPIMAAPVAWFVLTVWWNAV
jgi:phosphatidate cytidylyltransferase